MMDMYNENNNNINNNNDKLNSLDFVCPEYIVQYYVLIFVTSKYLIHYM